MPKPPREKNVTVKVDRALASAWRNAEAVLTKTKIDGARAWDQFWEAVGSVIDHDPPLYLAGGVSTIRDFLGKYVGEDERAARRNVRVAKYATPDDEARYTITKLDAVLTYLEAKMGGPPNGRVPIDFAKVRIPKDGHERGLPIEQASIPQVRAATRALGPKHAAKTSPVVAEVLRALRSVPKGKGVEVHYAGGYVSLRKIPAHAFKEVMRALARAEVPTPERR